MRKILNKIKDKIKTDEKKLSLDSSNELENKIILVVFLIGFVL